MAGRPKGLPKTGGRKKGVANKSTAERKAEILKSGLTPLAYMLSVLRNKKQPIQVRMQAANSAAPYVHPRLANIEHSGPNGGAVPVSLTVSFVDGPRRVSD